jgi:hypothetical protein
VTLPSSFDLINLKFNRSDTIYDLKKIVDTYPTTGRVSIRTDTYNKLFRPNTNRVRFSLKKEHVVEEKSSDWVTYSYHSREDVPYQLSEFENIELLEVIKEQPLRSSYTDTLFNSLLKLYFKNDVLIPYDLEERKQKFHFAFQKLDKYIRRYSKESK